MIYKVLYIPGGAGFLPTTVRQQGPGHVHPFPSPRPPCNIPRMVFRSNAPLMYQCQKHPKEHFVARLAEQNDRETLPKCTVTANAPEKLLGPK